MGRLRRKNNQEHTDASFQHIYKSTPPLYTSAVYTLSSYPLSPFLFSKKFLCTSLGKRRVTCLFGPQNYQHFFFFFVLRFCLFLLCAGRFFLKALYGAFGRWAGSRCIFWCGVLLVGCVFVLSKRNQNLLLKGPLSFAISFGKHGNLKGTDFETPLPFLPPNCKRFACIHGGGGL